MHSVSTTAIRSIDALTGIDCHGHQLAWPFWSWFICRSLPANSTGGKLHLHLFLTGGLKTSSVTDTDIHLFPLRRPHDAWRHGVRPFSMPARAEAPGTIEGPEPTYTGATRPHHEKAYAAQKADL